MSEPTTSPAARPPGWQARIGTPVRWALVGVVVVVALAIALWPRGSGSTAAAPAAPDLTRDRARAALPACPAAKGPATTGALGAVEVTCLANGSGVHLGSVLGGAPTLVNVWAAWCVPCQQELPALNAYAHQSGAVRVVGVQVQSAQQDGLDLLASLDVHLPTVFDGGSATVQALRARQVLPESYLVRPDGSAVLISYPGPVLDSVAAVEQAVTHYLGSGSGTR
jgi:thiol-disulfide isomerase/thioredoxin